MYIVGNKDIYDIKQQDDNKYYTLTNKETGEVMTNFLLYTQGEEHYKIKYLLLVMEHLMIIEKMHLS